MRWLRFFRRRRKSLGVMHETVAALLHDRRHVRRADVYYWEDCDKDGSIFKTSGDMAVPYCSAYEGALRTSYVDGSCLYPEEGDVVVTLTDGRRFIV